MASEERHPKRVYLHIGAPKTGTTFLQTLMWHNRPVLREQNLLYPGRRRWDHFLASQHVRGIEGAGEPARAWARLCDEVQSWHGDSLISHEFFAAADPEQAQDAVQALAPAEVRVVFTARDYGRQLPSVWQESLKMGDPEPFNVFVDRMLAGEQTGVWGWSTQDAVQVLERWGSAVPAERIHLITVPPPGSPPDLLLSRWCDVVHIEMASLRTEAKKTNQLLGTEQAALLHKLHAVLLPRRDEDGAAMHKWYRGYLAQEVLTSQGGERFGIPAQHIDQLLTLCEETARTLKNAGYHVVGDLDDLIPDAQLMPARLVEDVGDAEMLDASLTAIRRMLDDVRELTEDRDRWRDRALAKVEERAVSSHRLRSRLRRAVSSRRSAS